jgi:hypothetical protein
MHYIKRMNVEDEYDYDKYIPLQSMEVYRIKHTTNDPVGSIYRAYDCVPVEGMDYIEYMKTETSMVRLSVGFELRKHNRLTKLFANTFKGVKNEN